MKCLVIGATGVAGGAAISAIRQQFGDLADITAVWYGKPDPSVEIDGATRSIFGDITDPAVHTAIEAQAGTEFDWCFYATALGDVGFPVDAATQAQIDSSNRLSFDPLRTLEARFNIRNMLAYSTFYNLAHQRITYGAMGHSKEAIENWALETDTGTRHYCIRAGAFKSASSQGIKLLIRRNAKALATSPDPLLRSFFADAKPSEAVERLERAVFVEEREIYGATHTDAQRLTQAHIALFAQPDAVFINVCGQRIWASDRAQRIADANIV